MTDCVVVGYHESESSDVELSEELLEFLEEVPPPVRSLLRSRLLIDGKVFSYLDALSHLRNFPAQTQTGNESPVYSVTELPSLGTLYLVNYLRKRGISAGFVNSFDHEREKLAALISEGPLVVAITTTFYMFPAPVIEIVDFIRRHNQQAIIVVGGPLVVNYGRALPQEALTPIFDRMGADFYVFDSQGEATLHSFVEAVKSRGPAAGREVPNVFSKSGSSWTMASSRPESNNLNECSVDWLSFNREDLGTTVSARTARSCAFSCAFCDYPARAGALTFADVATVERELEQLASMGVKRVTFIDDTFNVPVLRFRELCKMMIRRGFGLEWFSYFRCSEAKEPGIYDLMVEAGCRGVLLGIESGDDRILKNMDKRGTTANYRYGIEQLKKRGVFMHASTVVGFPGESEESVQNTINFLNETGPDTFTTNHWYYSHATPIHKRAAEFDLTGEGFNWSHGTMNSSQAMEAADRMFENVTAPAWMPVNGLDFWGVPYLLGKGMTPNQIRGFLRIAKDCTIRRSHQTQPASQDAAGTSTPLGDLRYFCNSLTLTPARYRKSWNERSAA